PKPIRNVSVIGIPISAVSMSSALDAIALGLSSGEARGSYVCVSNAHTTVMAHDNESYKKVQIDSFLTLPDGKPLSVAGSKIAPEMERVTGPDLMRKIFSSSEFEGASHYFYGNTRPNVEALVNTLGKEFPSLCIAGFEPSLFRDLTEDEKSELCERIDASGADIVWMGLGAPRQEMLCAQLKGKTNALMVGVGGAFNVLAGIVPEAPRWMQNASLEWLYRLIQEPGRLFKRYAVTNTRFLYLLAKEGCSLAE
ncbi:WecB/TagA/CpsF family glycosyltransferase, partial [Eggerthella sinensis]